MDASGHALDGRQGQALFKEGNDGVARSLLCGMNRDRGGGTKLGWTACLDSARPNSADTGRTPAALRTASTSARTVTVKGYCWRREGGGNRDGAVRGSAWWTVSGADYSRRCRVGRARAMADRSCVRHGHGPEHARSDVLQAGPVQLLPRAPDRGPGRMHGRDGCRSHATMPCMAVA